MEALRVGRLVVAAGVAVAVGRVLVKPDSVVGVSDISGKACQTHTVVGRYNSPDGLGTFQQAFTVCEGETCPSTASFRQETPVEVPLATNKQNSCYRY